VIARAGAAGLSRPWRERYTAAMLEPGALAGALAWYRALPPSGPPPAVGSVKVPEQHPEVVVRLILEHLRGL
jgi:hypothetical protein